MWTRLLSLMLGGTVYTFSIILAVFLFGLGMGSAVGSAPGAPGHGRAARAGLVPVSAGRRDGLDGVYDRADRCPTGRSIRRCPPAHGTISSSIWRAACGRCCRRRCCGARVSRWRWRRRRAGANPARLVGGIYAANTVGAIRRGRRLQPGLHPALGHTTKRAAAHRAGGGGGVVAGGGGVAGGRRKFPLPPGAWPVGCAVGADSVVAGVRAWPGFPAN